MGAVNKRMPGKAIDQEIDGIKYKQEVELPNGHKWRQRLDGGWCRFSKRTCIPKSKTSSMGNGKKRVDLPAAKKLKFALDYNGDVQVLSGLSNLHS